MSRPVWRVLAAGAAAVVLTSTAAVAQAAPPSEKAQATRAGAPAAARASGDFTLAIAFPDAELRPVGRSACKLTVPVTIAFTGTLAGAADGSTVAVILASCNQVVAAPPGTFPDVFRFEGDFVGTVHGTAASGALNYAGVTSAGGAITAAITLAGDATAVLRAQAVVGGSGTYRGVAKPG